MVLKELSDEYILAFFNQGYIKQVNFNDKNNVEKFLKKFIISIKNKYNLKLSGIYDVKVYIDEIFGVFLLLEKIDSLFYGESIDFKVSIIKNCRFYYKTSEFDIIKGCSNIYFFNNSYYTLLNTKNTFINFDEYGEFVLDDSFKDSGIKIV